MGEELLRSAAFNITQLTPVNRNLRDN